MKFALLRSGFALRAYASLGIKVASVGLTFAVAVLLARLLGADGYGRYAFVYSMMTLLALPVQMGLPALVVRETAKAAITQDWPLMRGLWLWSHRCALAISAVVLAGVLAWFTLLDGGGAGRKLILIGVLLIPLIALGNIRSAALRGLGHVLLGQLPEFVLRPLFLVMLVAAMAGLAGRAPSPEIAMGLHVASAAAAFAFGTAILLRAAPGGVRAGGHRFEARAWAASAVPLGLISGLHILNSNLDVVMLGTLKPAAEVGVYKIAVSAAGLVSLGLFSINILIMPRIATAHATGERAELQRLVTASARLALAFALPAALVLIVTGVWLLEAAFGAEYRAGYPALAVLALAQIVNSAFGSVTGLLNMTGHERDTMASAGAAVVVNVAMNLALIPAYGALGAAMASTLSLFSWNALSCWRVWVRLGMNSTAFRIGSPRTKA